MNMKTTLPFIFALFVSGCSNSQKEFRYQMDYPIQAARLSIGGEVSAAIDCSARKIKITSDSSDGILSRHVKSRLNKICYKRDDVFNVIYAFDPVRGARQNLLATQPGRVLEPLNPYEFSDGDS